ncbi:response regulator transcription factor [Eubacteriaceae bacterium Marseille-Q4139]|nr:response regulator transcription factor [Eubacteriaceae bacterium Marseille-Q4139]
MPTLLIADDDARLRRLIRTYAELENYTCEEAGDGRSALRIFQATPCDLVILDVMMPGMDGFETLEKLREISDVPVIMLTARTEEYDKLMGFRLGVDDYVSKPFSPRELMARVAAVLRRNSKGRTETSMTFGSLTIMPEFRIVTLDGNKLTLPPKEFELLLKLAQNERIVLSRDQLLESIWGYSYFGDGRTIDTHIKSLREHLGRYRGIIQTVWGVGYKFEYDREAIGK